MKRRSRAEGEREEGRREEGGGEGEEQKRQEMAGWGVGGWGAVEEKGGARGRGGALQKDDVMYLG